ncbi:YdbL family protein [Neptuniibacter sp. 1_MG-2023]|uniref:YdbL family protein n=1 Tax=Neptuniibacter sp. 1_MG-2023 TaxID=3062662 RepID=UPI0026E3601F|nr:YdbL family protein [Neptuniibacter sp. 1_MG-2023]MDO6592523.1 YdbL family protein [Neptuniibacter sp. 1_MG-2023]
MKQLNLRNFIALFALMLSIIATPVWAISMDDAKSQGLIGERSNGYIGVVTSTPSAGLRSLVDSINNKRREAYTKRAAKAGVERSVFEIRMGQRLQQRTPAGQYIQLQNGNWQKK